MFCLVAIWSFLWFSVYFFQPPACISSLSFLLSSVLLFCACLFLDLLCCEVKNFVLRDVHWVCVHSALVSRSRRIDGNKQRHSCGTDASGIKRETQQLHTWNSRHSCVSWWRCLHDGSFKWSFSATCTWQERRCNKVDGDQRQEETHQHTTAPFSSHSSTSLRCPSILMRLFHLGQDTASFTLLLLLLSSRTTGMWLLWRQRHLVQKNAKTVVHFCFDPVFVFSGVTSRLSPLSWILSSCDHTLLPTDMTWVAITVFHTRAAETVGNGTNKLQRIFPPATQPSILPECRRCLKIPNKTDEYKIKVSSNVSSGF